MSFSKHFQNKNHYCHFSISSRFLHAQYRRLKNQGNIFLNRLWQIWEHLELRQYIRKQLPNTCLISSSSHQQIKDIKLRISLVSGILVIDGHDTSIVPHLWHRTIAGKSTCGGSDALPQGAHLKDGNNYGF